VIVFSKLCLAFGLNPPYSICTKQRLNERSQPGPPQGGQVPHVTIFFVDYKKTTGGLYTIMPVRCKNTHNKQKQPSHQDQAV
jgi:hypothetical protein